jgi:NADH-ubiquinone oxidoreductase chain 1
VVGSIRGVAQIVSYEISLIFIILGRVFLVNSFDFELYEKFQGGVWFVYIVYPLACVWVVSCLAETNRTPFDFSEGESELVSGFNVEYGGVGFAFIFISEYGIIMIMAYLRAVIFFGGVILRMIFGVILV